MKQIKVLAIASKGGHWTQLRRLAPFLDKYVCSYACTDPTLAATMKSERFYIVRDASMWDKVGLVLLAVEVFWLVIKLRPDVVISTGAAPGFFAIVFARMLGKKTIWVDSIANAEEMSLAGKKVKPFASVWLSQWPDVAAKAGAEYKGQVL